VTGPTGSGKTTTLYTVLKGLNRPETKIITIEDPIEYRMAGLVQMQVNPDIDFTFGIALRSILRHDPDIILIGETRDHETAEITIRTALTGHLVFTTLHTNDAPTAMGRLIDMGVEPFLIASSVEGVVAQRLVRLICRDCLEWYDPEPSVLTQLGQDGTQVTRLARGRGCRECRFSGYLGRTCIGELMVMNAELREMVTARRHARDIANAARRHGMRTLRAGAIAKLKAGLTTIEEVFRVTPSADDNGEIIVGED
jgi:type II secretory ATPase GspE/PulE/Tfp pilus assembly ATPase PilB-like protein